MKTIEIIPFKNSINFEVEIPGSKSYTNRALILAALTKGEVKVKNALFSDDTEAMINCLQSLGIEVLQEANKIFIKSDISHIQDKTYQLNAKLSGTTIRFILALSCIVPGVKILDCDEGLKKRPISDLIETLKQLGAEIEYLENEGYPPLKINSSKLNSGDTHIDGGISSQFISALMMIAPVIGGLEIEIMGTQISSAFIDMTLAIMEEFGIKVENHNYEKYVIPSGEYKKEEYIVEGDYTSASYFFAIATLTNSKITVKNLNPKSVQPDKRFVGLLEDMGNKITYRKDEVSIEGFRVKPIKVNMESFPDTAQTLAVLISFAEGTSILSGIKSLRVKETERVKALEKELSKMGIKTESTDDSLTIYGGFPKPAEIETYNDHRMAMAFAVAGTKIPGIKINNPEVVRKTFPSFWKKLKSIGVKIKYV